MALKQQKPSIIIRNSNISILAIFLDKTPWLLLNCPLILDCKFMSLKKNRIKFEAFGIMIVTVFGTGSDF